MMPTYALDLRTVTSHFPGIGRHAFNLARAISGLLAPSERLVLLHDSRARPSGPITGLASERVQLAVADVSVFSVRQQWRIPQVLDHCGADLYHSLFYLMPYRCAIPMVLSVADLIPLKCPGGVPWHKRAAFRWLTDKAIAAAALVIVPSSSSHRDVVALFPHAAGRTVTVPLAANPPASAPGIDEIASLRARYRLPARYVLYVGTNKPHKNLALLLDAWAKLEAPNTGLVLAGPVDPRYLHSRSSAGAAHGVHVLGTVPEADLPTLYAGAACLVHPSLYEGFGLPCLEAMACGTAVVCSNTGSLPEVVGDAALTFDPADVDALRDCLDTVLSDAFVRARLQKRARRRAESFSWSRTAAATLGHYRRTLGTA